MKSNLDLDYTFPIDLVRDQEGQKNRVLQSQGSQRDEGLLDDQPQFGDYCPMQEENIYFYVTELD